MKSGMLSIVVIVFFFVCPAPSLAQSDECEADSQEMTVTRAGTDFRLGPTNDNDPLGNGVDERTRWIFDFTDVLSDLQAATLTSALLTLNLTATSADLGTDSVGMPDDDQDDLEDIFDGLPVGVPTMLEIELLNHYTSEHLIATIAGSQTSDSPPVMTAGPGQLLMSYQDDSTVNSAQLELVFEGGGFSWEEGSGGAFSTDDNWAGGEVPGSEARALFALGGGTYTVTFSQSLTNEALAIDGDNVTFNLNGSTYTLNASSNCPALAVGPSAGSTLMITGGEVHAIGAGKVQVAGEDSKLILSNATLLYKDLVVEAATVSADVFVEAGGTLRNVPFGTDRLGATAGTRGNVFVTGTNARWEGADTGTLVGGAGRGTITINDGGTFIGPSFAPFRLAVEPGSRGDLTVEGSGSSFTSGGILSVGVEGAATMALSDGARGRSSADVRLAEGTGTADVTMLGAGTQWVIEEDLLVGSRGRAELVIGQGAGLESANAFVGVTAGSEGRVRIEDSGSFWQVNGLLEIGSGGVGVVRVLNGGQLVVGTLVLVGGPGVTATLEVNGGTCLGSGCPGSAATDKLEQDSFALTTDSLIVGPGAVFTTDTITFTDGAFLGGSGPFPFDIENRGTVSPGDSTGTAGTFTAGAGYTQTPAGTLEIELGGPSEGDYDRLVVTGTATLSGTLRLRLTNNFVPEPGQIFEIVRAGTLAGRFETVEVPEGLQAELSYGPTTAVVTVRALAAPSLSAPEDEAELLPPVVLQWQALAGASSYEVQVSKSEDFATLAVDEAGLMATQVEVSLPGARQYVWRVRGVTAAGEAGLWSEVRHFTTLSGVSTEQEVLPSEYVLEAAYPNPFNPRTMLRYGVPRAGVVRLVVYDALGREVAVVVEGQRPVGWHEAVFEAGGLPSGVYLARLVAGGRFIEARTLILLR